MVRRAGVEDVGLVAPMFDAYRRFYRAGSDVEGARRFLLERVERSQSVIFVAMDGEAAVGFTQLYPSYSSVSMAPIYILNDLFVVPDGRRRGVGRELLTAAAEFGRSAGVVRLALSTEVTNTTAQSVYESMGWKRDTTFYTYELAL